MKNPKRVLAGRKNRARRGPLSPAGRERLRATAREHRPWDHATGPRTEAGKARASANGATRQCNVLSIRRVRRELAEARTLIAQARESRLRAESP